jgi:hypothetical protein
LILLVADGAAVVQVNKLEDKVKLLAGEVKRDRALFLEGGCDGQDGEIMIVRYVKAVVLDTTDDMAKRLSLSSTFTLFIPTYIHTYIHTYIRVHLHPLVVGMRILPACIEHNMQIGSRLLYRMASFFTSELLTGNVFPLVLQIEVPQHQF